MTPDDPGAWLPTPPGRLGDPRLELRSDPRADPRLVAAMAGLGLDRRSEPAPVTATDPLQERLRYLAESEVNFEAAWSVLTSGLSPVDGVSRTTEVIRGPDDTSLTLHIHRPTAAEGPVPGVLHLHGGGMTLLTTSTAGYVRWRDELAATGMVVVGVEFRNAAGAMGAHPFPAGLDDCTAALKWLDGERERLAISTLVVSGDSGGGNLSLAVALRAKREGHLHSIDGVYVQEPFISGAYGWPDDDLARRFPSMLENDGYLTDRSASAVFASVYDPSATHARDPLCWPLWSSPDDLTGLPPHVIVVDELDVFRDEGLEHCRALARAGVDATARMNAGVCHTGEIIGRVAMPSLYSAAVSDVRAFADRLPQRPRLAGGT